MILVDISMNKTDVYIALYSFSFAVVPKFISILQDNILFEKVMDMLKLCFYHEICRNHIIIETLI